MLRPERPELLVSQLETAILQAARTIDSRRETLAQRMGQTPARWRLLSEASLGERSVPQLARRLELTRQSVQRTADQLTAEGLARYHANPDHVRSPHLVLTRRGDAVLAVLSEGLRREQAEGRHRVELEAVQAALTVVTGWRDR